MGGYFRSKYGILKFSLLGCLNCNHVLGFVTDKNVTLVLHSYVKVNFVIFLQGLHRTRKLRQIQALLYPTGSLSEVYLKHVWIQHPHNLFHSISPNLSRSISRTLSISPSPNVSPNTTIHTAPQASSHPDPTSHPTSHLACMQYTYGCI